MTPLGASLSKRPRLALIRSGGAAVFVVVVTLTSAGLATAANSGAVSATIIGPDVSSHNHDHAKVDWRVVHRSGHASFTFIKATEGGRYVNPKFASDLAEVRSLGLIRGAYHYARPNGRTRARITADATAEANHFIRVTRSMAGPDNLPPVLDLESAGTLKPAQLLLWTRAWLDRVESLTGRTPILYTYPSFWKEKMRNSAGFAAYPLWLAHYGVPRPQLVGGWKHYTFWQYTDRGLLAGSSRRVDKSLFRGSPAQLRAMTLTQPVKGLKPRAPVTLRPRTSMLSTRPEAPNYFTRVRG